VSRAEPYLSIRSLRCVRGPRVLINDLSVEVAAGHGLIITGPNGAGKSTLIRTIAGWFRPDRGEVSLIGGDDEKTIAEQCHVIGHLNAVKMQLSVEENLAFIERYFGAALPGAAALERFGLGAIRRVPAAYLSAGQKRRLALARLVMVERPLWLLDEPAVSLDAAGQDLLIALIREHLEGGGIVVAATHTPLDFAPAAELRLGRPVPVPTRGAPAGAGEP